MQHWLECLFAALVAAHADVLDGGGGSVLPLLTQIIVYPRAYDCLFDVYNIYIIARCGQPNTHPRTREINESKMCTSNRNSKPLELV